MNRRTEYAFWLAYAAIMAAAVAGAILLPKALRHFE